jgi:phosphatidylglycerophosphatase A
VKKLNLSTLLASCLGVGFIPKAPGTFGTLFAAGVYLLIPVSWLPQTQPLLYSLALLILIAAGILISTRAEKTLGRDGQPIVIDELIGFFVTMFFIRRTPVSMLLAFGLFRLFDITKPYPIHKSQALPQGLGVVVDDVLAGIYANICLRIIFYNFPLIIGN